MLSLLLDAQEREKEKANEKSIIVHSVEAISIMVLLENNTISLEYVKFLFLQGRLVRFCG